MNRNYVFRDVSEALPVLLLDLLKEGDEVPSRAGLTKEFAHVGITLTESQRRELLVPHRLPNVAAQIAETAWVLAGRDDITWLKHYLPRATDFSDDGLTWRAAYGPRLRSQLDYVVDLLKADPTSRQAVISLWDPFVDSEPGKDIACNNWLHFLSRNDELHLQVGIRSNDIIWGWSGINAFEWSTLLEVVAYLTGLKVGKLHFSVSSEHIYEQHWDRARQIVEAPSFGSNAWAPSPAFSRCADLDDLDYILEVWFDLERQMRQGHDVHALIDSFPEPMMQSWLYVLEWWWTGNRDALAPIEGTRLFEACGYSIQPPPGSPFIREVVQLHNEKAAAYGNSWCRRGETLGILANIARKVDRLGTGVETTDETSIDTAIDLLVYLAKYRAWLDGDDTTSAGNDKLREVDAVKPTIVANDFNTMFANLELLVQQDATLATKTNVVEEMLFDAYALAYGLWSRQ